MALRVKRSLEMESLNEALPMGCSYRPTPPKRSRNEGSPGPQTPSTGGAHGSEGQAQGGQGGGAAHSPFQGRKMSGEVLDSLLSSCVQGLTAADPAGGVGGGQGGRERGTYTGEEVRGIVEAAVSRREQELRAEYDAVLQDKLKEQFNSFTKFNQDYISRQIKGNPFSYVS